MSSNKNTKTKLRKISKERRQNFEKGTQMETLTIYKMKKTTGSEIWDLQIGEKHKNSGSSQTNTSFGHLDKGPNFTLSYIRP